jgi:general stress protein YciG
MDGGEEPMDEPARPPANGPASSEAQPKKRRGFGLMDRAAVRAIGRKGGAAAHARGTAHRFTTEEAKAAGAKGGRAPHKTRGPTIRPTSSAKAGAESTT